MDILRQAFPHAFKVTNIASLIITLVRYMLAATVCGVLIGVLAKSPVVDIVCGLLCGTVGLYALTGIILTILVFLKKVQ